MQANGSLTPEWLVVTIVFEFGVLGIGSYFVFVKLIPWLTSREGVRPITEEEREQIRSNRFMKVVFGKAKRWFDHPFSALASITMRGVAFILLVGVLALLLTSVGWHSPLSWSGLRYDILFARSNNQPNGAHLVSYLPIPVLGLFVAWKFRKDVLLNCYLGLLVCAIAVVIHEGIWLFGYYLKYSEVLTLGTFPNLVKETFFIGMLLMFLLTYIKYPFQKLPLRIFLWPSIIYGGYILVWYLSGMEITTINNFELGIGPYGITKFWASPSANAWEVGSWLLLLGLMIVAVWKFDSQPKTQE